MLPSSWRYKRFHVSYVFTWLSVGLLAGLFFGRYTQVAVPALAVIFACLLIVISLKSRRWYACIVVVLAGFLLGLVRGHLFNEELLSLQTWTGRQVVLTGRVVQDPTLKNGSNVWQVEFDRIYINKVNYTGTVYATIVSDEALKRGDNVTISGKALAGFGSFQVSLYRATLIHVERTENPFLAARDSFGEATRRVMPEPEASLGLGFVVGQKSALPDDFAEQLKIVGLTHIVVASGYNLTILVRFARRLLARRSRYLAFAGSVMLVISFVLVSGFSASMNRAAVVTVLSLLAWYYGRKFHPVQLIAYVASASAFIYPVYVWGDLGWLLSFAAFTGILVVAPIISRLMYPRETEPSPVIRLVIETLSAEIMTLPIVIVAFGYIPTLALLANILVAPVIPIAMLFTFLAGLVGGVIPVLSVLTLPATIVLAYVVAVVQGLSSPEWAHFSVTVPTATAVVWYSFVVIACWVTVRWRKVDLLASSVVE